MNLILLLFVIRVSHMNNIETKIFSLDKYTWKNRVVLIVADESGKLVGEQIEIFGRDEGGIVDRDLLIFKINTGQIQEVFGEKRYTLPKDLKDELKIDDNNFQFILIGKDGGVKLRSNTTVKSEKLYGIIDAMPMRQAEMRRKN